MPFTIIADSSVKKLKVNGLPPIFAGDKIRAYFNLDPYAGRNSGTGYTFNVEHPSKIEKLDLNTGVVLATYNFGYSPKSE